MAYVLEPHPDDGWSSASGKVAVLKRGATLQFAREAMLLPEPRPGTLQAIARVLNP